MTAVLVNLRSAPTCSASLACWQSEVTLEVVTPEALELPEPPQAASAAQNGATTAAAARGVIRAFSAPDASPCSAGTRALRPQRRNAGERHLIVCAVLTPSVE